MRFRPFASAALALAVLVTASAASAQTQIDDDPLNARDAKRVQRMEKVVRELRSIVFQLRDTGQPVVVQPADTDARMAELATRISDIENTLQRLNGSFETVAYDLDQARRENKALRADLQSMAQRLAALEQAAPPAPPETVGDGALAAPAPGDPVKDFAQARQMMLGGDYSGAEAAFAAFVDAYPDGARSAEARYWLGKTLTVRGANADAAKSYIGAIRGWPQTPWAPDAVVELSRSLVALKKPVDACQTLAEFTRRYPKAPANVASRAAAARTQAKCAA